MALSPGHLAAAIVLPILFVLFLALAAVLCIRHRERRITLPISSDRSNPGTAGTADAAEQNTEYMRDKLGRDIQVTETVLPIELVDSNEEEPRRRDKDVEAGRGNVVVVRQEDDEEGERQVMQRR